MGFGDWRGVIPKIFDHLIEHNLFLYCYSVALGNIARLGKLTTDAEGSQGACKPARTRKRRAAQKTPSPGGGCHQEIKRGKPASWRTNSPAVEE